MSEWIGVGDRLPITESTMKGVYDVKEVIVYTKAKKVFSTVFCAGKTYEYWSKFHALDVTHWQPLPEPPKP